MDKKKINKQKIFLIIILSIVLITFVVLIIIKNTNKNKPENKPINNFVQKNENQTINESKNEINNEIENETNNEINKETNEVKNTNETNVNTEENTVKNENASKDVSNKKFDGSVAFIGDSRTQGFLMYTGLKDVVDYTYIGLMVDTAVTKEFVKASGGKKVTILEDMKTKDIDTVYIMLGINELGWSYSQVFVKYYGNLIDEIRKVKPNCKIYLQSIIPVTKEKSDSDDIYNNNNIRKYNELIKKLAQDKNVTYLDVASYLADSSGNLPSSASTDGVHVNKEYCLKWYEYLKNN